MYKLLQFVAGKLSMIVDDCVVIVISIFNWQLMQSETEQKQRKRDQQLQMNKSINM